jgi:hypothetical protein
MGPPRKKFKKFPELNGKIATILGGAARLHTWCVEWHRTGWVAGEERRVVGMKRRSAVPKLKFTVGRGKVWETGPIVEPARREVHGEAAHLARPTEKRSSAHAGQLLQAPFFGAFVLKPDLATRNRKNR